VNFRRSYITHSVKQMIKKWEKEIILVDHWWKTMATT